MKLRDFMTHRGKLTCMLDTNVIFPVEIRDILFWLAHYELYTPKWSRHIFDEWTMVMRRKGIPEDEIVKRTTKANRAFPFALVTNYQSLIHTLALPDMKDRHVLAAAIRCKADLIVTNNIKDFPPDALTPFGLSVKNADEFLAVLIASNRETAILAFRQLVMHRTNPNMDEYGVLEAMRRNGLQETSGLIQNML